MNFLFAWRYFKAKKSTNAINIISWISIVAMMVGTTALILVLSVFNGFEGLVKSLYTSFYPDIKILPVTGKQLVLTQLQLNELRRIYGVTNFSLVAEEKALLQNGDYQSIIFLKGVDENYNKVSGVAEHLVKGEFNTGDAEHPLLVLGAGIENAVSVQSDRNLVPLLVYLPRKSNVNITDPLQSINADTVNTAGTFVIQQEFDNKYAITNLAFVKQMLEMPEDNYTAVEIGIDPTVNEDDIKKEIENKLGKSYTVLTRYEQNRSLYAVMRAEKWVIYIILSIILVVAAFNMIGALTMLVLEKKADISVLHSLGARRSVIQNIFLSEGLLLGFLGGGIGMLLALMIASVQIYFKVIPLQGGSFLIDYFPVTLSAFDFILVGCTVIFIAVIASYIPARKAARQQFVIREE
ncbi:MAG TPA: FtsX-like permease family protein [Chitinophagaceae bacterium]|nr:FtsX-like permease family protein [Chitinophagaceae bacterium]